MNGKWQYWLNSLATIGGNVFLLCAFVLIFLVLTVYCCMRPNTNPQVVGVVTSAFTSFSGALLLSLKGRTTDVNPSTTGGTSVSSTTQTTTVPVPPTA